jgi:hypothetical protein
MKKAVKTEIPISVNTLRTTPYQPVVTSISDVCPRCLLSEASQMQAYGFLCQFANTAKYVGCASTDPRPEWLSNDSFEVEVAIPNSGSSANQAWAYLNEEQTVKRQTFLTRVKNKFLLRVSIDRMPTITHTYAVLHVLHQVIWAYWNKMDFDTRKKSLLLRVDTAQLTFNRMCDVLSERVTETKSLIVQEAFIQTDEGLQVADVVREVSELAVVGIDDCHFSDKADVPSAWSNLKHSLFVVNKTVSLKNSKLANTDRFRTMTSVLTDHIPRWLPVEPNPAGHLVLVLDEHLVANVDSSVFRPEERNKYRKKRTYNLTRTSVWDDLVLGPDEMKVVTPELRRSISMHTSMVCMWKQLALASALESPNGFVRLAFGIWFKIMVNRMGVAQSIRDLRELTAEEKDPDYVPLEYDSSNSEWESEHDDDSEISEQELEDIGAGSMEDVGVSTAMAKVIEKIQKTEKEATKKAKKANASKGAKKSKASKTSKSKKSRKSDESKESKESGKKPRASRTRKKKTEEEKTFADIDEEKYSSIIDDVAKEIAEEDEEERSFLTVKKKGNVKDEDRKEEDIAEAEQTGVSVRQRDVSEHIGTSPLELFLKRFPTVGSVLERCRRSDRNSGFERSLEVSRLALFVHGLDKKCPERYVALIHDLDKANPEWKEECKSAVRTAANFGLQFDIELEEGQSHRLAEKRERRRRVQDFADLMSLFWQKPSDKKKDVDQPVYARDETALRAYLNAKNANESKETDPKKANAKNLMTEVESKGIDAALSEIVFTDSVSRIVPLVQHSIEVRVDEAYSELNVNNDQTITAAQDGKIYEWLAGKKTIPQTPLEKKQYTWATTRALRQQCNNLVHAIGVYEDFTVTCLATEGAVEINDIDILNVRALIYQQFLEQLMGIKIVNIRDAALSRERAAKHPGSKGITNGGDIKQLASLIKTMCLDKRMEIQTFDAFKNQFDQLIGGCLNLAPIEFRTTGIYDVFQNVQMYYFANSVLHSIDKRIDMKPWISSTNQTRRNLGFLMLDEYARRNRNEYQSYVYAFECLFPPVHAVSISAREAFEIETAEPRDTSIFVTFANGEFRKYTFQNTAYPEPATVRLSHTDTLSLVHAYASAAKELRKAEIKSS